MARKSGYWLDTNKLELIQIYDHVVFLSELEAKVRNELSLTEDEARWGQSLGLKLGKGWGTITREAPGARRLRFMTLAMKAGWVRIREREETNMAGVSVEFWGGGDEMLASIAWGLKQAKVSPTAVVELHDLKAERAWQAPASALYAKLSGGASREQEAEVGFDVYSNPPRRSRVGWSNNARDSRTFTPHRNPGGYFYHSHTGRFEATAPAQLHGAFVRRFKSNPAAWEDFVDATKGEGGSESKLFVGLTRGVGKRRNQQIAPDEIVQFVKQVRTQQLGGRLPGGASFISQRGFFTDWKKKHLHPDEDSLQVLIYPEFEGGEDTESYVKNMKALALLLAERFDQEEVIGSIVADGTLRALGRAKQK